MNQEHARASASQLQDHAAAARLSAARLKGAPSPAMPPSLKSRVGDTMTRVSAALGGHGDKLGARATELNTRASTIEGPNRGPLKEPGKAPVTQALHAGKVIGSTASAGHDLARTVHDVGGAKAAIAVVGHSLLVAPAAAKYGESSLKTLNAQVKWESVVSKYMNVDAARKAVDFNGAKAAEEVTGIGGRIAKVGGGVFGVVGLYEDAHILAGGSPYHGTRGLVDRVMAGVAIPADAGAVFLVVGSLPAAGELAIGVLAVGVTAYALGNLVYDERAAIAKGIVSAASYLEHNPELLAGPAGELGKLVYDNRAAIEHAAGQIAGTLANGGTALANDLQTLGKDAGEGATIALGGLETGANDAGRIATSGLHATDNLMKDGAGLAKKGFDKLAGALGI